MQTATVTAPVPPAGESRAADFEAEAMGHARDLYRVALRMLRDADKAHDAVQQAYLLAWKSFDRYERGTNCRAWLFGVLFNVVRHERRTWTKWLTGREEDVAESSIAAPSTIPDALTDQEILGAIDRLPEQFRSVVLLVDVEEFSYKEASAILKTPIGTIMSRLSRARGLLRKELEGAAAAYGIGNKTRQA